MLATTRHAGNPRLSEHVTSLPPLKHIDRDARRSPDRLASIAAIWPDFIHDWDAIEDLFDDGIEAMEFVVIYQRFLRLIRLGVIFAPSFRRQMQTMLVEIVGTINDGDSDIDIADHEFDNSDTEPTMQCVGHYSLQDGLGWIKSPSLDRETRETTCLD